jgi:predicted PurR-regulated permease PerM
MIPMKLRPIFLSFLFIITVWFLFVERAILTPFIVAAIFSYILTPVVNFFEQKFKIHRIVSILLTYVLLLLPIIIVGILLSRTISLESLDIRQVLNGLLENARQSSASLPEWLRPITKDLLVNLQHSKFIKQFEAPNVELFFSQAISRVISLFIFIFSSFYFLKDGGTFTQKVLTLVPNKHKEDVDMLLKKANLVLAGYLRGQVFLIFFVAILLYIAFLILGVRFALTLAVFSGFAEIVPVIGPITAGTIAVIVVLLTGTANFGLSPISAALIIAIIYFIFRHLEDYLIIPIVMEKVTKLPPFFVFFAVVTGGHLAGVLGLILAVPVAAIIKLLLEYSLNKINEKL